LSQQKPSRSTTIQQSNQDVLETEQTVRGDANADWFVDERFLEADRILPPLKSTTPTIAKINLKPKLDVFESLPSEMSLINADQLRVWLEKVGKAARVDVVDVRGRCSWTDMMVVVEGNTEAHVRRMAETFYREVRV
jgi:hypothetical protein